jgi:hypothetical protein
MPMVNLIIYIEKTYHHYILKMPLQRIEQMSTPCSKYFVYGIALAVYLPQPATDVVRQLCEVARCVRHLAP